MLPKAELGDYEGLEVPRREAGVETQQVEQEIDGVRERLAKLETAERAAEQGDFVVIDYVGSLPVAQEDESPARSRAWSRSRAVRAATS